MEITMEEVMQNLIRDMNGVMLEIVRAGRDGVEETIDKLIEQTKEDNNLILGIALAGSRDYIIKVVKSVDHGELWNVEDAQRLAGHEPEYTFDKIFNAETIYDVEFFKDVTTGIINATVTYIGHELIEK